MTTVNAGTLCVGGTLTSTSAISATSGSTGAGERRRHRLDLDQQRRLYVGNSGSGTLNITGGGSVSSGYDSYIGYNPARRAW